MTEMEGAPLQSDGPEPLWRLAADAILHEIATGKLASGARLPPERDLFTRMSISRVTLRRALQSLVEEGVLTPSHGRGWYVSAKVPKEFPNTLESFSETARRLGLTPSSDVLRAEEAPASLDEAEELSIAPGATLFHLERIRRLDQVPVAVDTSFFAVALFPDLGRIDFRNASLFGLLIDAGVDLARAETTIEARGADPALARHLDLDVGKSTLVMRQLIVDSAGRPLLSSTIRYAGDRYRLRTSFSRAGKAAVPRVPLPRFKA
ncbi:GntR family transcriptional regulator [Mesorhizobium sp. B2-4-12]|uniref:GntR family transcriptional regulator n=1 Tax=Mesorhizobium sp. B2-4-12 TaxID=2589937 RepID=UPI0011270678|nr:GntR family transcriptional regulator [Mesorhizobium sp. B2-4-12]TPK89564.1 GntR family transcriptional regulator [Mesorhizobium sp. B2-4-12]